MKTLTDGDIGVCLRDAGGRDHVSNLPPVSAQEVMRPEVEC